ncbi:GNAT family N-acetyltransferase [Nocardioides conyzicola]|uniref:N-acetyltransferase domain-containing protein n=1 Tax=Nocardioides conyzicola TaxID=1651781 RepID=A0ABP8WYF8_9ACTN
MTKHMLGPHVVGQRVVVRRVLRGETGPSGGPALTDLLGNCLAWGDGGCVVQPETGPAVTIALADIVSGKPVPPRPSPRHRVTPLDAQRRALALWPDLATEPLGDWTLRHSPTSTARRANSVLAVGPSGVDGDYHRVVDFYATRTGRPIAAVLPDSAEDALFRSHGWVLESHDADTLFQIASVAQAARVVSRLAPPAPPPPVTYDEAGDVVTVRLGDRASGVAAYGEDWVGFRSIEVAPAHRRQGLGVAVMAALLEWGAEQGASTAYLQVLGDNVAALGLYERLGFVTHHAYRYLTPA